MCLLLLLLPCALWQLPCAMPPQQPDAAGCPHGRCQGPGKGAQGGRRAWRDEGTSLNAGGASMDGEGGSSIRVAINIELMDSLQDAGMEDGGDAQACHTPPHVSGTCVAARTAASPRPGRRPGSGAQRGACLSSLPCPSRACLTCCKRDGSSGEEGSASPAAQRSSAIARAHAVNWT